MPPWTGRLALAVVDSAVLRFDLLVPMQLAGIVWTKSNLQD
jgi:hypothetical protein